MKVKNLLDLRKAIPCGTKVKSKLSTEIKVGEVTGYFGSDTEGKGVFIKVTDGAERFIGKEEKLYLSEVDWDGATEVQNPCQCGSGESVHTCSAPFGWEFCG